MKAVPARENARIGSERMKMDLPPEKGRSVPEKGVYCP
jgi:hypothetical protein